MISGTTGSTADVDADLLVIGSGVAGLSAAQEAALLGLRVVVVTKGRAGDGNTRWAQGGVAVVRPEEYDEGDSIDRHVADTLEAGAGLCDAEVVRAVLAEGAAAIGALQVTGARFDTEPDGRLARTREGGHTAFRVVRAGGDATGAEVQRALLAGTARQPVAVLEHRYVTRLLRSATRTVVGAELVDEGGRRAWLRAPAVLLATGGLGQLYDATSNPDLATADGIALALRAGAEVADLEFVQFHPTVLYAGAGRSGRRPLVTEAVRGEGARLVDVTGAPVTTGVHPRGDLAPRDVVSAAITRRLAGAPGGVDDHVFLDTTHLSATAFRWRFPTVWSACAEIGIDPSRDPIPVAPAAHFACGGVLTTVEGRTAVPGLYAAGEVARTGLHGANRLASNSLLEGLVVGRRSARAVAADLAALGPSAAAPPSTAESAADVGGPTLGVPDRATVQHAMSRYAAIGRDLDGMSTLAATLDAAPRRTPVGRAEHEDAALWLAARALTVAAAERAESRGCHVRTDRPDTDDARWRRSLTVRMDASGTPVVADAVAVGDAA